MLIDYKLCTDVIKPDNIGTWLRRLPIHGRFSEEQYVIGGSD